MQLDLLAGWGLEEFGSNVFGDPDFAYLGVVHSMGLVGAMTSSQCGGCAMPGFIGEDLAMCEEKSCRLGVCRRGYCHYVWDEEYAGLHCHNCGATVCQKCWDWTRDFGEDRSDRSLGNVLFCVGCEKAHVLCGRCECGACPPGWHRCEQVFANGEGCQTDMCAECSERSALENGWPKCPGCSSPNVLPLSDP